MPIPPDRLININNSQPEIGSIYDLKPVPGAVNDRGESSIVFKPSLGRSLHNRISAFVEGHVQAIFTHGKDARTERPISYDDPERVYLDRNYNPTIPPTIQNQEVKKD